jgi:hypothetical protein
LKQKLLRKKLINLKVFVAVVSALTTSRGFGME